MRHSQIIFEEMLPSVLTSLVALPGFLIFLVVVSFNFVGDGLQEALDPKTIPR